MSAHINHLSDLLAPRIERREVATWSSAALLVVALHVASGWLLHHQSPTEPTGAEEAPAVMLDLAPMLAAPQAVPLDIQELVESNFAEEIDEPLEMVEPEPTEAVAERVIEADEVDPVEQTEVAGPTPDLAKAVEPEEVTETKPEEVVPEEILTQVEEVVPDLIEATLPDVALAVPEARPLEEQPPPIAKKVAKKEPAEEKLVKKVAAKPKPASKASQASTKSAQAAERVAAPAKAGASGSSVSPAKWASKVRARILRASRSAKGSGVVTISFAVTASGQITSVSVAGSSGDPALDLAAINIVRRASPVPAPPPGVARNVTVPVRFKRG
jgi:periplasmic protein TonB